MIPWVGVTAAGYGLGQIYRWDAVRRRALLLRLGLGLTAAFPIIRAINKYGDPLHWSVQKSTVFTVLVVSEHAQISTVAALFADDPGPSDDFPVGGGRRNPAMAAAGAYRRQSSDVLLRSARALDARHRGHRVLRHYGQAHWMFESNGIEQFPVARPPGWGYSLPMVYLIWAFVVVALYPLCKWYAGLKQRSSNPWLSYL